MTTVHILVGGYPLCGFTMDPPAKWPAEHGWTQDDEKISCSRCRVEWEKETPDEILRAYDKERAKARAFE